LELEVLSNPVDALQIDASVGYIHHDRVDPGTSTLCRYGPDGELCPAPRTPEWTAAVGATYNLDLDNASSVSLRADMTWQSPDDSWSEALFGTNLTDKEYFHGKLSLVTVLGREQGNIAAPREWGVTVKRLF
jgi:iron complex outermembrane receptor protein